MAKKKEIIENVEETKVETSEPTFIGEGPLSGEYRFAEIAGSIAASSKEEAVEKAKELMVKNPGVLK